MINNFRKHKWKYLLSVLSIVLFVGFSFYLLVYLTPEKIVNFVGVNNAYTLMFVTAIFGGFTTFNIIPYHPLLITLSVGGLNPLLLGLLAASGVSLGDSTSYLLGREGRIIVPEDKTKWFDRMYAIAESNPKLFLLFCLLFSSLTPLSNDLITIPAGLAKINFWKVMIPLFLGNIIFDISLAFLAPHFYPVLQKLFF